MIEFDKYDCIWAPKFDVPKIGTPITILLEIKKTYF